MSDQDIRDEKGKYVKKHLSSEQAKAMSLRARAKRQEDTEQAIMGMLGSLGFEEPVPEHIMVLGKIAHEGKSGAVSALDRLRRLSPDPAISQAEKNAEPVPEPEPAMCASCKLIFGSPAGQELKKQLLGEIRARLEQGPDAIELRENPFNSLTRQV